MFRMNLICISMKNLLFGSVCAMCFSPFCLGVTGSEVPFVQSSHFSRCEFLA
jgi:hypothetical protein